MIQTSRRDSNDIADELFLRAELLGGEVSESLQGSRSGFRGFGLFLDEPEEQHASEVSTGGDIEGLTEAVVLHHVTDDQRPDRARDETDEIVNRERRVGKLRGGKVADHGLGERATRLDEGAVKAVSAMIMSSACKNQRYRLRLNFQLEE